MSRAPGNIAAANPTTVNTKLQHQRNPSTATEPDVHYTILIRLPFPREDFVDPPQVNWDSSKDKKLWKILSQASKDKELDWKTLAEQFDVTLSFLLQQAAWLYEQHLSQVRAQMRKVGGLNIATAPSPVPGSTSALATGGQPMKRAGSGGPGQAPRAPSSLSMRSRDSPKPRGESSVPGTPSRTTAPPMSRTSSASTAVQALATGPSSPRQVSGPFERPKHPPLKAGTLVSAAAVERRRISPATQPKPVMQPQSDDEEDSSSSSDDEQTQHMMRSQAFKRPAHLGKRSKSAEKYGIDEEAEEEDDDDPAFLPIARSPKEASGATDPGATLRGEMLKRPGRIGIERPFTGTSSASSASSAAQSSPSEPRRPSGPLSPRRTAELSGKSPRGKKEGSDGTPSMGSSFSDLDDASVTQSALEEALLSNMRAGGVASKMSTISQAFKSRYM